jgi:alkylation response protein AidB-like acyl-CoA dehydrogenase
MLNLDFSDEQNMLRDMVRGLCSQYADHEAIRAHEDDPVGYSPALWAQLGELGILGMTIPESAGGSGMTLQEGVVVYEELGRCLAPSPHLSSCIAAAGALIAAQSHLDLLPGIADGSVIITPAWLEPNNGFGPRGVQIEAQPSGDQVIINGTKQHAYFASSATWLLVLAHAPDPHRRPSTCSWSIHMRLA